MLSDITSDQSDSIQCRHCGVSLAARLLSCPACGANQADSLDALAWYPPTSPPPTARLPAPPSTVAPQLAAPAAWDTPAGAEDDRFYAKHDPWDVPTRSRRLPVVVAVVVVLVLAVVAYFVFLSGSEVGNVAPKAVFGSVTAQKAGQVAAVPVPAPAVVPVPVPVPVPASAARVAGPVVVKPLAPAQSSTAQGPSVHPSTTTSASVQAPVVPSQTVQSPTLHPSTTRSASVQPPVIPSQIVQSPTLRPSTAQSASVQAPVVPSPTAQTPASQPSTKQSVAAQASGVHSPGAPSPTVQSLASPSPLASSAASHPSVASSTVVQRPAAQTSVAQTATKQATPAATKQATPTQTAHVSNPAAPKPSSKPSSVPKPAETLAATPHRAMAPTPETKRDATDSQAQTRPDVTKNLQIAHGMLQRDNLSAAESRVAAVLAVQPTNRDALSMRDDLSARQQQRDAALDVARGCEYMQRWTCAWHNAGSALVIDSSSAEAKRIITDAMQEAQPKSAPAAPAPVAETLHDAPPHH